MSFGNGSTTFVAATHTYDPMAWRKAHNVALLASYLWQPVGLDVPLMRIADNAEEYYIVDGNKNVIALKDSSGVDVSTYTYTPFGAVENPTDGDGNPFRFSSEYVDDETGLVYYNYRYYSPEMGRWLKRDPIGEQRNGGNLYTNCLNNLIIRYDILGLITTEKITPFYVGGSKLDGNDKSTQLANTVGFRHVDLFEKIPTGYIPLRIGAGGDEDRKNRRDYSNYTFYALSQRKNGFIRWGDAKKKQCSCATVDDIRSCLLSPPRPIVTNSTPLGPNCQTDIEYTITGCCLSGYSALNQLLTPENYQGDNEKVNNCYKKRIQELPYLFIPANQVLTICKYEVMQGYHD